MRNEKGSPVHAKDENGKSIYEYVKLDNPKLCSSDFWAERGGQLSYGNLQDDFYERVSCRYGLERGEVGSNKKHTTKYQWQKQQQQAKLDELLELTSTLDERASFTKAMMDKALTELTDIQQRKDEASEEFKSIQEYLDAFHEAEKQNLPLSPTKLRKMVIGLMTEYKRLESEKAIGDKDKQDIFNELRKTQRRIPELERHKELIDFLNEYAPDKLDEAQQTATQRRLDKLTPKNIKSRGNYSTK